MVRAPRREKRFAESRRFWTRISCKILLVVEGQGLRVKRRQCVATTAQQTAAISIATKPIFAGDLAKAISAIFTLVEQKFNELYLQWSLFSNFCR